MRRLFFRRAAAMLLALICCLSVLPAMAESYPLSAYATANLNLRQQPNGTASVLLTIPSGDMVLITGENGDYYVVTYEGKQGYALKQYLRVVEGGVNLPAVTPAPEGSAAYGYEVLYSGSKGDAVKALQSALKELGFYSGKTDGEFGSGTRSAVTAFQAKNGLTQSGTADGETQALLYEGKPKNSRGKATKVKTVSTLPGSEITSGSIGPAVVKLQTRLKELGYYTGAADGTAGKSTIAAIKAFQKKNDLRQSNTADVVTLALLYSDKALPAKTAKTDPTPTPLPTANPANTAATFPFSTYTTDSVNIRKSASTTSQRLGTVPKGSEITVLSITGDFLKVTYKDMTGYIVSEYAYVPPQYAPGKALKTDADAQKNYPYLQSGDTGKDVTVLQDALRELGFYDGKTSTGTFDAATVSALKAFQKANNIRQDGIATPEVQKLIFEGKPVNGKGKKVTVSTLPNHEVKELHSGQKGEQVVDLQVRLNALGMFTAPVTGVYDSATVSAVKKFQETHKLVQDGKAGEKTLRLLSLLTDSLSNAPAASPVPAVTEMTADNVLVMRKGTKGTEVTRLQTRLKELGFYTGALDGVYSDAVVAAVKDFQRRSGLTQDGVAGVTTQQALYSDFAVSIATPAPTETPIPVAVSPTPIVISSGAPSLQTLKTGSKGDLVKALQTKLKALGYYTGEIDGDFGSSTAAAVKEFQRRNGLHVDGVAGENTLKLLYGSAVAAKATAKPTTAPASDGTATVQPLKTGDSGAQVRAMQARLVELGYLKTADGVYGPATYNAVVAFQKKNGLTADGVAGVMTLNRLNSANAISSSGTLLIQSAATEQPATSGNSSSASFTPPSASKVQYANWYSTIRAIAKSMPDVVIYDPDSGLHFNLHMFSFGKHADSETPTAADTAVLNQVVGVNEWTPKYVWVCFPDGQVYIGSIHSHGHEVDHTPGNNLEGHICLHFPRVMSEAEQTGPYAVSHQKEINWGWELTQAMAK